MAKRCPSCGYSPIGPFTDNCPICAEPVRNVRSDGPRRGGGMGVFMRWLLAAVVAGVLGIAGCCGYGTRRMRNAFDEAHEMMEQARAKIEAERKARTIEVKAADLLKEFEDDAAAAESKYKGKYLVLSGSVERTGKNGDGISFAVLHAPDDWTPLKIECFFGYTDDGREIRVDHLAKGQTVTVRGEYSGRISHVQMRGCVLDK